MLQINAKPFALGMDHIGQLTSAHAHPFSGLGEAEVLSDPAIAVKPAFDDLEEVLVALDLKSAVVSLGRVRGILSAPAIELTKLQARIDELRGRIFDGLSDEFFLLLSPQESALFRRQSDQFGPEVAAKFPKAAEDISEASRCLAVGCYTAVVFHLMRAMEVALQEVGLMLEATTKDADGQNITWGVIANNVKLKINQLAKGAAKDDWNRIHAHFDSIGRAWRNPTMHPKQTYTEDEAKEVYSATRGFMTALAPMLP